MKFLFDIHTHTTASDGKSILSENIAEAENRGLMLGASEHGAGHWFFSSSERNFRKLKKDIAEYNKHSKRPVMLGIEGNLLNKHGKTDLSHYSGLDYHLLGFHKGVNPFSSVSIPIFIQAMFDEKNASVKLSDAIVAALADPKIGALTHPGEYLPIDMKRVGKAAAENGVALEINEKHPMTQENLIIAAEQGAKFLVSSDAHLSTRIGVFNNAIELLEKTGINGDLVINSAIYQPSGAVRLDSIATLAQKYA